jgi:putative DNA primase/helicase
MKLGTQLADAAAARRIEATNPLLSAALRYTRRGWYVLPLHSVAEGRCRCAKGVECKSAGKHPLLGRTGDDHAAASRSEFTIRNWWRTWPLANVGIVTGARSGLVVLDVDPAKGGLESLAQLFPNGAPSTLTVATGGGGLHFYLKHPGGRVPCRVGFMPGLDVRGDGGLVVAPPSGHASGLSYSWK